ncbi:hypothetical protein GCM10010869_74200 [Mesorhizobium tianshanense]|uniref:Uncharacterized membrane protein YhaH (DUF805 family) n=1 Tax=Mesorhizobium tianshanense TaxID=39844 RepID=A0A562NPR5_9HYPH|nr:DUF805 domain-containing protein [Mesorhizobium tianshanense]TWI34185.1 uncharacterized membrane protein YhaH (DUF805 family) [Mesorhizobium tianshanense]GLS41823.1 hypothetical protein GCM10010869_74200 [Mesorhizobium tianshanense]
MRGEVLHYDEDQGFGFITGADGNRYTFARENLRREASIARGTTVEFQPSGGQARDVLSVRDQATTSTAATATPLAGNTSAASAPRPQHFGRSAGGEPAEATGLWDYFWRGLTQNYVNFAGRARRKEFWGYCLFWTISLLVIAGIGLFVDDAMGNFDSDLSAVVTVGLCGVFVLATFLPGLGMTVRRIHDIGLSGWFYLVVFIPTIGWLIILVFALIPTQARENQWGPVP